MSSLPGDDGDSPLGDHRTAGDAEAMIEMTAIAWIGRFIGF
jgi:hypothetical protein